MIQRTIVEESTKNMSIIDVFSKLAQERIIFIDDDIDDELANGVIAQMLYLDSSPNKEEIKIYINSQGGSILAGLAIYDVAKLLKSPIKTVCIGCAASMAAILMLIGQKRCATKHSRLMLHQPSSKIDGNVDEIQNSYEFIRSLKNDLYRIIEDNTLLRNADQLFKLDTWYTAEEALECNLITEIL